MLVPAECPGGETRPPHCKRPDRAGAPVGEKRAIGNHVGRWGGKHIQAIRVAHRSVRAAQPGRSRVGHASHPLKILSAVAGSELASALHRWPGQLEAKLDSRNSVEVAFA